MVSIDSSESYRIESKGNRLRFFRPILEEVISILSECYENNHIPDLCLPNANKEISLTPCLYTAAYTLRNRQSRKYFPAAEVPVTRYSKVSKGRLDLALFSKKKVSLIECKHARISAGKGLTKIEEKLKQAESQLLDIESFAGTDSDIFAMDKIALVSATLIMPFKIADNMRVAELSDVFWSQYARVKKRFNEHMVAGVFLGQHHINGKLENESTLSKNVSIGQFFVLKKL